MSAAAPWSVKGIDPKAREIAKDLARRSGMTLGEWLNQVILEDEEDGVMPLSRRAHARDAIERRSRQRRLDDAYGHDAEPDHLATSLEAIVARLEASEQRSSAAVAGVDRAVNGLLQRMDSVDEQSRAQGRRINDIADELREGHRRLRRFENDVGPQTTDSFRKVEEAMGALSSRFYELEERQRDGFIELRQRTDRAEEVIARFSSADVLGQVSARLDAAQARTTEALRSLERSFATLDQRLSAAETRGPSRDESETSRFEKLAEGLSRQVETNRTEMMRRLDAAAAEGRIDKIERAVMAIGEQVSASERRSAGAVEAMGREVLRMAQNLNQRMVRAEEQQGRNVRTLGETLTRKVEQDLARMGQGVEQRLTRAEDRHALAIEKLGGEITRISERLAERIAESERRSAQALDDIGERLKRSSEKIEQQYDRASGELAERMRQSEERTAQLLAEARDSIGRRTVADDGDSDWRSTAFPDVFAPPEPAARPREDAWTGDDPLLDEGDFADAAVSGFAGAEPFARLSQPETEAIAPQADMAATDTATTGGATPAPVEAPTASPFGGFGGADVGDALENGPDAYDAETEFVGVGAAHQQRAASTRNAIAAARAAMTAHQVEDAPRRGGKSRLQERLDRQSRKEGSTVRKTLLASVTAVAVAGAVLGYMRLTDGSSLGPGATADDGEPPLLASSLIDAPVPTTGMGGDEAATLYQQALERLGETPAEGVELLTRAANLGHAEAQFRLARLHETGEAGVPQNAAEARLWTERAALAGEVRAMHNMGVYLFGGEGGGRDPAAAARWFRQAAEQGLTDSQYNLAHLYEQGADGVTADAGEAYKWYLIAGRSGDGQAQAAADRLAAELPAAARRSARRAADAFTAPDAQT